MTRFSFRLVVAFLCITPNFWAQMPYQNPSLTPQERAVDLTSRLTLKEKIALMVDASRAVDRLGVRSYNWWNEALHGVARAGIATVFPQPIGMAATFDDKNVYKVFTAVSDEARAKNTRFAAEGDVKRYQGLTMWTPNVNIFRDPRWGRGMETYGEDPFLTAAMGVSVVTGLQGPADQKYDKLHACAKHFAVHSGPEWNRHTFDVENISKRDLYETYLPAFKALVKDAQVKEVMCAYNRLEGEPCCGNKKLLNYILRKEWGYQGIVVADCGAIADFYRPNAHGTHADAPAATADAVLSGTDLDCGSSYPALMQSVEKGLIREKDIDVSVVRLLKARFELGEMDNPALVSWTKIPYSVVASAAHDSLAYYTALQSMTLLQNRKNVLPLSKKGITVAVMGPNAADSVLLWGNYNGSPRRTRNILDGIREMAGKDVRVIYEKGCSLVDRTLLQSAFENCNSGQGRGFAATYWNNTERTGAPVATAQVGTPFNFCTSGATVFAPGVNLTDFGASYQSVFKSPETGKLVLSFFFCGEVHLIVNDVEVKSFKTGHGTRNASYELPVVKGTNYSIRLLYSYTMGDAQLNFDMGFERGVDLNKSVARVAKADVVIFVGGISPQLEGEEMGVNKPGFRGGDRTDIELPAVQRELIAALHRAGKKVVFVNCSGSAIGMEPEVENCDAILQAWYPGQEGGKAVGAVLFGAYNPAGRLPLTFYRNINQVPDFLDYRMKGRTYRYFTGSALFPFGYGLSYSGFVYGKATLRGGQGNVFQLSVPVKNTGKRDGDEVVQVYIRKAEDADGPLKTLRAFRRVTIPAGQTRDVEIELNDKNLEWWDAANGQMRMVPGDYQLFVGGSSRAEDLQTLRLSVPVQK